MKTNSSQFNTEQKGFVLLFTIVVTAIIFFIGAGIYSVSFKELLTSSLSKESQKSIFAADSGAECAMWADTNGQLDGTTRFPCMGNPISPLGGGESFTTGFDNGTCARVNITKDTIPDPNDPNAPGTVRVNIISQGYNKCTTAGLPVTNYAGLTERVYKVSF